MTFDNLWEQEEQQALQQRLRQEYPRWQRARRVRRTALASMVAVAAVILPIIHHTQPTKSYDSVACNRSGIADSHWASEAGRILTIKTL